MAVCALEAVNSPSFPALPAAAERGRADAVHALLLEAQARTYPRPEARSDGSTTLMIGVKHGLKAGVLALALVIGFWFTSLLKAHGGAWALSPLRARVRARLPANERLISPTPLLQHNRVVPTTSRSVRRRLRSFEQ